MTRPDHLPRRLTGFKPTGSLHLGSYLGAIRPTVDDQDGTDSVVLIADLHALTAAHTPDRLGRLTHELAAVLLACGLDPDRCTLYVQSHLAEHAELHYLLECTTSYGEAHRMIQFRERARAAGQDQVRLSLLTYPVLMAADVLLHGTEQVPVGDDQSQHVELARDVAVRFNHRYSPTFTVPAAVRPAVAARVMNLSDPRGKMGKSQADTAGVLGLLDPPDLLRRKVARAVTDTRGEVRYDPVAQPGVANLLDILAALVKDSPLALAPLFGGYGELKQAVADAVVATLRPIRQRYADLAGDPDGVAAVLRAGAARARPGAAATVRRARTALGLVTPGVGSGTGTPASGPVPRRT